MGFYKKKHPHPSAKNLKYNKNGRISIKTYSSPQRSAYLFFASLLLITITAFLSFDYKGISFLSAVKITITNFISMFSNLSIEHFTYADTLNALGITFFLALLTTIIGSTVALFFAFICARNLSTPLISSIIYKFAAVIRAVPTILWVLIFAISIGLGSEAAVVGMSFHTFGYLTKAYAESFERVPSGTLEALRALGATWWQVLFRGVIPNSIKGLSAWTLMRFEINFANAVAMGAAAGAGGIGFDLFMSSRFYFNLGEVGFITLMILLVVVILENTSTFIKNKYLH